MQIKDEKWRTTEMNKPLKWFQGWTAQSETDQHHSGMRAMTGWLITQKDRKEAACKSDHSDNTGLKSHSQWFQMLFYCKFKVILSFTGDCSNLWRSYFKSRCVTWRAACVESLFPLLLCYSLCSDMFLSPSSKFPSFRERSEARDCDLPWGWVKDFPPRSLPWEMGCSLFCIHLSLLFSLGSTDRVQKELLYPVSSSIFDCSDRSISAPQPVVWSHCACWKRGKKHGNVTESSACAVENKALKIQWI